MEGNPPWNTNASPIDHFDDGSNNNGKLYINIYSQNGHLCPVELVHHDCNEERFLAIPPNAYHLIVGVSLPTVQTTVLDHGNTQGNHIPHGIAQMSRTAEPSNASGRARSPSFHGSLQDTSPLQASNLGQPQCPQAYGDIWSAQTPGADLPQGQLGSGALEPRSEYDNSGTRGLSDQGTRGNLHGANSQANQHGYGFSSASTQLVPTGFQGDRRYPVDMFQSYPSFDYSAGHLSSPGFISSTIDPLQEPLGPRSMESVNAQLAAIAQDLRYISESSQAEDNPTEDRLHATARESYRNQFSSPVPVSHTSLPDPDTVFGEGFGHRDLRGVVQDTHPEPVTQGLAPQKARAGKQSKARAGKQSKAPRSTAGSPSHTKKKRGHRTGPLSDEGRAHANRVRKSGRKNCKHKRDHSRCSCSDNDGDQPVVPGNATQSSNNLLQPPIPQQGYAYGSTNTHTSPYSSFTGPTTNTRSTLSPNPSFASYGAMSTPADTTLSPAMLQHNLVTGISANSNELFPMDDNYIDAPGDTDDEVM